jgi:transcription termination/antitermination protein NusG
MRWVFLHLASFCKVPYIPSTRDEPRFLRRRGAVTRLGTHKCDPKGGAVSTQIASANCIPFPTASFPHSWYAVQTRSRHEKLVAYHLETRGVFRYLPTVVETHRWSDRRKRVELPLFPGYVFVRVLECNQERVKVLRTPGVVRFVGHSPSGTPIPDVQIESIRTLIAQNVPWSSQPFLKVGQRVRIRGGSLDGVEGIFLRRNGEDTLVISVDAIQRSLSISVKGYDFQVLSTN